MKTLLRITGFSIWTISGLSLFILYLITLNNWLGILGIVLGFIIAPGVFLFPIVFWIIEGIFPLFYFILWGISILGGVIMATGLIED